jgi:hypothetical protein
MTSAAEAELGALFVTAKELVPIRQTLIEMGWKHPMTPIQTDNTTAAGVVNNTIIQGCIVTIYLHSVTLARALSQQS